MYRYFPSHKSFLSLLTNITYITGFGLVLHTAKLIDDSGVGCEIWIDHLPLLPGVYECMNMGLIPAGTYANRTFAYQRRMKEDDNLLDEQALIVNDAQTNGGLLMALDPKMADEALQTMLEKSLQAATIGQITGNVGEIRLKHSR